MTRKDKEQIIEVANQLAKLVKSTPEYNQFMLAKAKLDADDENRQLLTDLRIRALRLEMATVLNQDVEQKERLLDEVFATIATNPVVGDYLNAEYSYGAIVANLGRVFDDVLPEVDQMDMLDENLLERLQMVEDEEMPYLC